MKKWTITVNLLFYITFLNQWKAVESQSASSNRGSQSAGGGPAGGQSSTPTSQNGSASSSSQSRSSRSPSQPGKSASQPTSTSRSGTPASQTQPAKPESTPTQSSSQSTGTGTSAGQGSQSSNPESQPKSSSSATDQSSSGTAETQEGQSTTPVSEVITPTTVQQTSLITSTERAPAKASVTVIAPTGKPRPKKTPEVATGPRTPVTLDIGEKASNSAVDFKEDYLKNVMVFSAKEKCVFDKIVRTSSTNCCGKTCCESETVIWEANGECEYFQRVYVDGLGTFSSTKNLSIHLCNGTFKHFNKSTFGGWSESPGVVDLDVRITNSNIQVDYFQKDNYRIYAAKPGYTIRKVVKSKKCSSDCCCSPNVIWEAHKEHALKVVLMGSKKEPKHLAVLLKSGELTLLFKGGKGEPWQDITSSKNNINDLKMYAMADGKSVELHRGHYSITLFNEFYGYLFYDGVGCVKVTHNGKTIWDLKEERDFGCLKGVFLDLKSNKFNVMNDDDRCWVCEEVRKVNPVTLDISSKASTDDFDYTVDHNRKINIYTSKGNAMFNQVIKKSSTGCCGSRCCGSETVIWEASDPQNYASKVFADGVGACSSTKNVSIYLLNGDILHFSEGDNVWKQSDNKIILDVDKTSSTIGYDFVHQGETRTFTSKPGYQFKTVMLSSSLTWLVCGSSCCKSACLSDHIFWEAEKDEECSTKVTVYGVKTTVTNINIFLKNNEVKHFHKADGKWVSETSIVLDIDKNKDNDLFEYRSTRNFGHFNPMANLTIEKIVKTYKSNCCASACCGSACCGSIDELVIWTAQPDDHGLKAVLMGSGKDEKFLSILLKSGNFVLLRKCGKGECWEDITQEKSDFSDIKMYSLEEGTSKYHELTGNDYDPIIFESRYGYEFKDGVKCVKITYNDNLLWSHTDDAEFGYLKGLYLDLPKDQFSVTNLKDQTKQLTKGRVAPGTPKPKYISTPVVVHDTTPAPAKSKDLREEVSITLLNLDIDQKKDSKGFYFCGKDKIGTFTAKFGYGFNVVIQKGNEIWNTNDIRNYAFKVVIDGVSTCGTTKNIDIFLVKGEMKQFNRSSKNKPWMEKSIIMTLDLKNSEKKVEYNRIVEDIFTTITTNNPFLIDKIVNPKTFFSECCGSICVSKCCGSNCCGSECCGTNKFIWESKIIIGSDNKVIEKHANKVIFANPSNNMRYLAILLTTEEIVLLYNSTVRKCWEDITDTMKNVSELKGFNEDDTELDSSQYKLDLNKFSYGIKFNYMVKCHRILYKDKVIYNYDGDENFEFLRGIYLYLSSNRFYIVGRENETKLLGEEKDLITLDVNKKQSTIEYQFVEKTNYGTFVCRDSFFFNKITHDDKLVWESSNDKDYSYKVVIDGVASFANTNNITLHLVTGKIMHLYDTSNFCQSEKWSEKYKTVLLNLDRTSGGTEFDYKGDRGKNIFSAKNGYVFYKIIDSEMIFWDSRSHFDFANKVVSYGSGSKKDNVLLFHENNTVTNFYKTDKWYSIIGVTLDISLSQDGSSFFYVEDYKLNVEVYYPELKRVFIKVIESKTFGSDTIIWEAENPEEYATKVLTDGCGKSSKNRVTIHMSNGVIKHFYKGGMCKPWSEKSGKIMVDIKENKSTIEFDYVEGFFKTYTPKAGYQFIRVVKGKKSDIVFWESESDDEYATEVKIVPFESSKYLLIFVNESKFVIFHKGGKDKTWTDITETRYDLANLKFYKKYNDSEFTVVDSSQYKITNKNTSYIYTFKCDVECDLIQYMDKTLYIFNPDFGYPSKIYFDIYRNSFHAFFSEDMCHRLYLGEEIEAISLDIGIKNSTDEFDYVQTEEVERYIPKLGFMFNYLSEKRTGYYYTDCCKFDCCGGDCFDSDCCECECECDCCDSDCFSSDCCDYECFESGLCSCKCCYCQCCDFDCCGSACCATKCFSFGCRRSVDQIIWKTEDPLEYCTKVIIDSSEEDEQTLTVIMYDGFKQVFTRSHKTEPWEETTENKRIIETSES